MIHSLCTQIVNSLICCQLLPPNYKEWSIYVLEFRIQSIIGCFSMFVVGCLFAPPVAVLAFLGSLYLINSRSGGYHCSSFRRCYILSLATTAISLIIANSLTSYPHILIGILLIATFLLWPAPLNNKQIQLSENELHTNRRKLRYNQCMIGALILILLMNKSTITMYVAQGYLSASLSIFAQAIHLYHRKELS